MLAVPCELALNISCPIDAGASYAKDYQTTARKLTAWLATVPVVSTGDPGNSTNPRILIVDDEAVLLDLLRDALRFAGYEVTTAMTGFKALEQTKAATHDLIVLDINLPDIDGFEVCRRLRSEGNDVPIVFLTARDDQSDVHLGFTRGGDDYLTKPFSLEELDLRIKAILRRRTNTGVTDARLTCGALTMDDSEHRVWLNDVEVELSPTEYRLLHYLLLNQGQALSKAQILDHVWRYDFDGRGAVVETYISYLRRKLDQGSDSMIKTVRGIGYALRSDDTPS